MQQLNIHPNRTLKMYMEQYLLYCCMLIALEFYIVLISEMTDACTRI